MILGWSPYRLTLFGKLLTLSKTPGYDLHVVSGFFVMYKYTHAVSLFDIVEQTLRLELRKGTSILSTRAEIKSYLPTTTVIVQVIMISGGELADRAKSRQLQDGDLDKLHKAAWFLVQEATARNYEFTHISDFITPDGTFSGRFNSGILE